MAKFNKKKSEEIAAKVTGIFNLIENSLDETDIEYLKATRKQIRDETGKLESVAGILVPLEKAQAKEKLGKQAVKRIDGIIAIWEAVKETPKIQSDYTFGL